MGLRRPERRLPSEAAVRAVPAWSLLSWAPVAAASLFLALLAARFGDLLSAVSWNSDAAFFPVLAEHLPAPAPGAWVSLGNTPHYISLAFLAATRWLPGHAVLWDVAPLLVSFAVAAILGLGVARLAGRWAGAVTAALCVAPAHPVLLTVIPHAFRTWTWLTDAVLGLLLIAVARGPVRPGRIVAAGAAVAILAGFDLASDPLVAVAGLGPFVVAALLHRVLRRSRSARRTLVVAAGVAVVSLAVAVAFQHVMRWLGFVAALAATGGRAPLGRIGRNAHLLAVDVLALGNGLLPVHGMTLRSLVMGGCAVLTVAALAIMLSVAVRALTGHRAGRGTGGEVEAAALWTTYWALSCLFVAGAFVVTTFGGADPEGSSRYLPPVLYGVAAVLPLWAASSVRRRVAVGAGVAIVCLAGIWGQGDVLHPGRDPALAALLRSPAMRGVVRVDRLRLPLRTQQQRILAFLRDEGVSRGYAGYWDSHSFTWHSWHTGAAAAAYPVIPCGAPASGVLCPLNLASASRWYETHAGRSFLLVGPPGVLALGPPPPVFGPPAVTRRFGPYAVHVFDYDIASRFGPAPPPEGLRRAPG